MMAGSEATTCGSGLGIGTAAVVRLSKGGPPKAVGGAVAREGRRRKKQADKSKRTGYTRP